MLDLLPLLIGSGNDRSGPLDHLLNSLTEGFYCVDDDWKVLYWNEACEEIFGLKKSEILKKNIWDLFPGFRESIFYTEYHRSKQTGEPLEIEAPYEPNQLWVNVRTIPISNGMAFLIHNKTKKHLLSQEVSKQRNQLEVIINAIEDVIWSVDTKYRLLAANEPFYRYSRMYGNKDISVGQVVIEWMDETEGAKWKGHYDEALSGRVSKQEMTVNLSSTETMFLSISYVPIYDDTKQQITGVACYARDVTKNRRYIQFIEKKNKQLEEQERTLRSMTEQLNTVLNSSPDLIATVDHEGHYVSVNGASRYLLQYEPAEMEGQHFSRFVHEPHLAATQEATLHINAGNNITAFRNKLARKDGTMIPILWSARWDAEKNIMFCVGRDASVLEATEIEKKSAEVLRDRAMDTLREQNRVLRQIAFMQSHEVRRPLANILSLIELVDDRINEEERKHYLLKLKQSTEELDMMIRSIVEKTGQVRFETDTDRSENENR